MHLCLFLFIQLSIYKMCVSARFYEKAGGPTCGLITVTSFPHKDSLRRACLAGSLSSGPCSAPWDGLLAGIERRCFHDGALVTGVRCWLEIGAQQEPLVEGVSASSHWPPQGCSVFQAALQVSYLRQEKKTAGISRPISENITSNVILLVKTVTKPARIQGACGTGVGDGKEECLGLITS